MLCIYYPSRCSIDLDSEQFATATATATTDELISDSAAKYVKNYKEDIAYMYSNNL